MGIKFSRGGATPPRKCERKAFKKLNRYRRPDNSKAFIWKSAWIVVKITNVYDGDTCTALYLDSYGQEVIFSVRLMGIDAAEMPKRLDRSDVTDKYQIDMALAAKQRVEALILDQICYLRIIKWDKWGGRILGDLFKANARKDISQVSISQQLLNELLVVPYAGKKKQLVNWKRMWRNLT